MPVAVVCVTTVAAADLVLVTEADDVTATEDADAEPDAVVVLFDEAMLESALLPALAVVVAFGLPVKLLTNGS